MLVSELIAALQQLDPAAQVAHDALDGIGLMILREIHPANIVRVGCDGYLFEDDAIEAEVVGGKRGQPFAAVILR